MPVLPEVGSDDGAAGLQRARFFCVFHHGQRNAVLDRAAGVAALGLHPHVGRRAEQAVDANVGRVADGLGMFSTLMASPGEGDEKVSHILNHLFCPAWAYGYAAAKMRIWCQKPSSARRKRQVLWF